MTAPTERGVLDLLLRAELKIVRPTPYNAISLAKEIAEARAAVAELIEHERVLREALERIEQAEHPDSPDCAGSEADFGSRMVGIARAALARCTASQERQP